MDQTKAFIVIGITLFLVVLFNLGIYASLSDKKGKKSNTVDLLRDAFKKARNPWVDEDNALKELSEIVAKLHNETNGKTDD
jgi:hypothetical protein